MASIFKIKFSIALSYSILYTIQTLKFHVATEGQSNHRYQAVLVQKMTWSWTGNWPVPEPLNDGHDLWNHRYNMSRPQWIAAHTFQSFIIVKNNQEQSDMFCTNQESNIDSKKSFRQVIDSKQWDTLIDTDQGFVDG